MGKKFFLIYSILFNYHFNIYIYIFIFIMYIICYYESKRAIIEGNTGKKI